MAIAFFLLLTALLDAPSFGLADQTCGYNYTLYNNYCYRLHSNPLLNYHDARIICLNDDADLVSIHDAFANAFVQNLGRDGVLIGLRYDQSQNGYAWSDGTSLDYANYADGFIEYHDIFGDCAKLVKGKWTNAECGIDKLKFVCRKNASDVILSLYYECPNATAMYYPSGMLLSPGYPEQFEFDQQTEQTGCYYRLAGKNEFVTKIQFDELFFQEEGARIVIYNGWNEDEANKVVSAGHDFEGSEIIVDDNLVLLHLVNASHGRWKVTWKTFPETPARNDSCPAESIIYATPGMIYSPGYPANFELPAHDFSTACQYRLIATEGHFIRLHFEELLFEDEEDRIEVYAGWSDALGNKISDPVCEGSVLLIGSDSVFIRINTTAHMTYRIKWSMKMNPSADGWTCHNDACYFHDNSTRVLFADARAACAQMDSSMVSITSEEENGFVVGMLHSDYNWLGLVKTDIWRWDDGSALTYTNWRSGHPVVNYPYAFIYSDRYWYSASTTYNSCVFCKQHISKPKGS